MFYKTSIFTLFFVILKIFAPGQVPDLRFSKINGNPELTSDIATCITQDSAGFIWIGTNQGLNCYDGYKVIQYKTDFDDVNSLVNNSVNELFVSEDGRLWIATNSGLCFYDKNFNNFKRIASEENYAGLKSLYIKSVNQDPDGNLYVSAGNIIYRYDAQVGKFDSLLQIGAGVVNDFIFDEKGNIWVGASDEGGLIFFDIGTKKVLKSGYEENNPNSLANSTVRSLSLLNDTLWVATYGGGINALDLQSGKFKRYPFSDPYFGYTFYTYVDRGKNLWTCDLTGIKFYDRATDSFNGFYPVKGDDSSIKHSAVAIIEDRQGNYWTIHTPGGVGLRTAPMGFNLFDDHPYKYWKLSENNIASIGFDSKGNWWVGNGFNGIDVFDYTNGFMRTYHYNSSDPYSLGKGGTECIFRDKNGKMWIGTNLGGLQYFDEPSGRFYSYVNNPEDNRSISNNDIRSIAEDRSGSLWVVTHGKGIDRFDTKEKVFYHYNLAENNLSNDWAFQLVFDGQENLWVGTAWGLSKLKNGEENFNNYLTIATDSSSVNSNIINCLFVDSKNHLWIGTPNGLNLYIAEKDCFFRIEKGLAGSNIYAIREGSGFIWASTSKGISRVNPETFEIFNFDENDGLIKGGYHLRSSASNGNMLFFGGVGGLTTFNPDQIRYNSEIPEIIFTGLKIDYEPVRTYGENSVLKQHISQTKEITLAHSQKSVEIEYVSNNLINPQKNRFKYKIEGFDKKWIDAGTSNRAIYTHLPPGKYTFRVIGSNNDGVWNETGASLQIRILPSWWSTWFFRIIIVLILIGIIRLYFRWKNAAILKQRKLLEMMVRERTNDLNEKNILLKKQSDDLNNANSLLINRQETIETQSEELKLQTEELKVVAENLEEMNKNLILTNATKDKLFSIIAHDLKNPFNVILGFSNLLIENFETWGEDEKLEVLHLIKESSNNTYNLLENLLNWSRSQSGSLDFNPVTLRADEVVRQVIKDVSSCAQKKGVKIEHHLTAAGLEIYADLNILSLICRNLLMNAIKFSNPEGKVTFDIAGDNTKSILFSVNDQGVGMDAEKAKTLFDPGQNTSTQGTEGEKGTGLGLLLCHEFVLIHQGEIWVESQPGKGATFFFTIPKAGNVQS